VAARVIARTCMIKPCSQITTAAFASTTARRIEPTVRSTSTFA
jgi:hypothetical protein